MKKSIFSITAMLLGLSLLLVHSQTIANTGSYQSREVAKSIDIFPNLALQEKYNGDVTYRAVTKDLHWEPSRVALKKWQAAMLSDPQSKDKYLNDSQKLKTFISNDQVILLAAHYVHTKQNAKLGALIDIYFNNIAWVYAESQPVQGVQNGRSISSQKAAAMSCARGHFNGTGGVDLDAVKTCFQPLSDITSNMLLDYNNQANSSLLSTTVANASGKIGGNKVELLVQIPRSAEYYDDIGKRTIAFRDLKCGANNILYRDMDASHYSELFSSRNKEQRRAAIEGIYTEIPPGMKEAVTANHPSLVKNAENGEENTFYKLYNSIKSAQHTIFIDVFFLGGSLGATFAKMLVEQSLAKKDLKVFIIHDSFNSLGFETEMKTVKEFLKAYSLTEDAKGRFFIVRPYLDAKNGSLPPFMDFLTDKTIKTVFENPLYKSTFGDLPFYLKGKSDHSKVFIVDGAANGTAFVGSKNLTDSSGGIAYDEVISVKGPAVAAIQNSYYYDLLEAISHDEDYQRALMGKANADALAWKVQVANSILKSSDPRKSFDLLDREATSKDGEFAIVAKKNRLLQNTLPENAVIAIGQNTVYGFERTPLIQDIKAILEAKRQIIINDQFLYDPYIVRALIAAKKRNPSLKIYALLAQIDHPIDLRNQSKQMARMPNVLFLHDMLSSENDQGNPIQIKWKTEPEYQTKVLENIVNISSAPVNGVDPSAVILSPEFHLKAISIDGVSETNSERCQSVVALEFNEESQERNQESKEAKRFEPNPDEVEALKKEVSANSYLVVGSANKDNMTMLGGFREFQLGVTDRNATVRHDCSFWNRWKLMSAPVNNDRDFLLPEGVRAKGLNAEDFLQVLKEAFLGIYEFQVEYPL